MKRTVLVLLIAAVASTISLSQTTSQCKEIEADIVALRSFFPRLEGSVGGADAREYIVDRLEAAGLQPERRPVGTDVDGHSFSSSITVTIPGALPETLTFAAPLNHADEATPEADGSGALASALGLARVYADSTPPVTLRIAFLAADHDTRSLGSRALVAQMDAPVRQSVVYLARRTDGTALSLRTAADNEVAPRWIVEDIARSFETNGVPYSASFSRAQAGRARRTEAGPPIGYYLANDIPAVALVDGVPAQGEAASPCRLSSALADLVEEYQAGLPTTWDRHYIFLQAGDRLQILGETAYVVVLILVIVGTLLYGLLFRGRLSRYLETFGRNFFNLPIVFLVIFGALSLAGALLTQLTELRDFPTLWQHYPGVFFLTKMVISAAIYVILHRLLLSGVMSKNGSYYSASALASLFIGILVLAAIDVSTTPYFLWAYLFAFFFSILRLRVLKLVSFVVSTIWLFLFSLEVFSSPLLSVAGSLVSSTSVENLIIAVVLLPFVLMLVRVDFLFRRGPITGRSAPAVTVLVALIAGGIGGGGYLVFAWPFGPANPQPVTMTETVHRPAGRHTVVFESEASLGTFDVQFGEETLAVQTDQRRFAAQFQETPELVSLSQTEQQFLNRSRRRLTVDPAFTLSRADVRLRSQEEIAILDANFPVGPAESRTTVRFQIGPSPPMPLLIDYTVPTDLSADVVFRGEARRLSRELQTQAESVRIFPRLVIHQVLEDQ
ncbi:MAG: hypothetical protein GVY29_09275 [Spirochaetes bacterium]|jgi:hypothetical protein|nr:hypothetical protein [Spirochaetota bacterium]